MLTIPTPQEENDRALRTLALARETNRGRTVGIRIDARTTVYIKPEQAADKTFIDKLLKRWRGRS